MDEEEHKGWKKHRDGEKHEDGASKFKNILSFTDKAKHFSKGMDAFIDELDDYLGKHKDKTDCDKITMEQLFKENYYAKDLFDRGGKLKDELFDCIQKLPEELDIQQMIKEFQ